MRFPSRLAKSIELLHYKGFLNLYDHELELIDLAKSYPDDVFDYVTNEIYPKLLHTRMVSVITSSIRLEDLVNRRKFKKGFVKGVDLLP